MFDKLKLIKNEAKAHPKEYPALAKIIKNKEEIRAVMKEAVKEIRVIVNKHPEKFPNVMMFLDRVEMWKEKHLKGR
jgi:hypothetical protein